jgi:hypothetical protein
MDDMRWDRALLNGLFVWLVSLVIYMVPAFAYAFMLAAQLGPGAQDYAALSQQISQQISDLYEGNWFLLGGLLVIVAVLIFWRARVVARGTWNTRWLNGLIVGAIPAVLSWLFVLCGGFDVFDIVTSVVYLGVGLLGGLAARPS